MKNRKTALGLTLAVALLLPVMAFAVDYTVRDVPVSASAEDASTARMLAMEQAEKAAFAKLLEQMLPPEQAAAKAASTPSASISALVNGYDVKNEKLSARSYGASIDVTFNPAKVNALLANAHAAASAPVASAAVPPVAYAPRPAGTPGAAYTLKKPPAAVAGAPVTPPPVAVVPSNPVTLLLPVYAIQGRQELWEPTNLWREVWNGLKREDTHLLRLPIGDQSDKLMLASPAQAGSYAALSTLAERYQAGQVVLAQASQVTASTGVRALQVRLTSLRPDGTAEDYPLIVEAEPGETPADVMRRAAQEIAGRLTVEGRRVQAENAPPAYMPETVGQPPVAAPAPAQLAPGGRITVLSRLNAVSDWIALRKRLQAVPSVTGIELSAISSRQADLVLQYAGSLSDLEQALLAGGMQVSKAQNYWVIAF